MSIAIKAENLSKQYNLNAASIRTIRDLVAGFSLSPARRQESVFHALQNVSFELEKGDVCALIGRNGAGKSTLLKILSRITEPSSGRARICGRVGSLLEVGVGFHPELTGRDNVFLCGALLGMKYGEVKRKLDEIVAFAQIEKFLDTPVKRYSSGMFVRLGFSVAINLEQDILFVDEVLAVGDAAFQSRCLKKLTESSAQGKTVLFVSHNIGAALSICRSALYLEAGVLKVQGLIQDVAACYQRDTEVIDTTEISRMRPNFLQWDGRRYGDQVRFDELSLIGHDAGVLVSGDDIEYEFVLSSTGDFAGLQVVMSIIDGQNNCIGSTFQGDYFALKGGEKSRYRMAIRNLKLVSGQYSVRLVINSDTQSSHGTIEFDLLNITPAFQIISASSQNRSGKSGSVIFDSVRFEKLTDPDHPAHTTG